MEDRELRELVARLVGEILDEATERKDYVEAVFNVMLGALGEHFKARYAEANGDPDPALRAHWDAEVDAHFMFRFDAVVGRRKKGTFDPRKAFDEAMEDLRDAVPRELRRSAHEFAKDFKLDPKALVPPPDSATDEFLARCQNEFEQRRRR